MSYVSFGAQTWPDRSLYRQEVQNAWGTKGISAARPNALEFFAYSGKDAVAVVRVMITTAYQYPSWRVAKKAYDHS